MCACLVWAGVVPLRLPPKSPASPLPASPPPHFSGGGCGPVAGRPAGGRPGRSGAAWRLQCRGAAGPLSPIAAGQRLFSSPAVSHVTRTRFGATPCSALAVASNASPGDGPQHRQLAPISASGLLRQDIPVLLDSINVAPSCIAPGRLQPQIVVRESATRLHASGGRAQ